jgi:DNA gyrase subunit A
MNIGKIKPVEITEEMQKSYLDYAMSVIVSRALPDIKDGLKPVHRRILYTMHQMGLTHTSRYTKSAKIVGETMGKYHPHGDMAIYDTLVRLAQNFSMRYPLVDGQGNFGSVDGDPPAAMRYTEARLSSISQEILADIEKDTVDFIPNFDGSLSEPTFLPARLPNLLLMGADGIAVGMATKIPPHNLNEVVDALVLMIKKGNVVFAENNQTNFDELIPKISFEKRAPAITSTPISLKYTRFTSTATVEELLTQVKGPDFPTGGQIFNQKDLLEAYTTGRGKIIIRGKATIEEDGGGKFRIIIAELPYQVNKSALVEKIAHLAKEKKLKGVRGLRDESDRRGMRIVIDLKKDAKPKALLNQLYKFTQLQTSFPCNFVALIDGTPQLCNLKTILSEYLNHRHQVITRKSQFELKKAKERVHILEGLKIALDNLDAVIQTIKRSKTAEIAKERLMKKFSLTDIQATAILDMQLRRLAALERQKIEDEYKLIKETIEYLEDLLAHPAKILKVIQNDLLNLKKKFGDERRTKVFLKPAGEFSEEDLVPKENCIITLTQSGYIKRLPPGTYRSQRRGGKGVTGMTTKEQDEIAHLLTANTHETILFFTNKGRVFSQKVYELPEGSRVSKGQAVINLINIDKDEKIQSILTLSENIKTATDKFLFMVTKKGTVKKTKIEKFANLRTSGLIAIKLDRGDELCWVKPTTGKNHILLISHLGKSIHFNEHEVRPTGRDTMGVRGILLKKPNDYVVDMEVFNPQPRKPKDRRRKFFRHLLVIMEKGIGKRTNLSEFPLQKRGGQGVKVANVTSKTGNVICSQLVSQQIDQVVLTSKKAQIIKLPLKNIPILQRPTQGVILMRFSKLNDTIAAVTVLKK